MADLGEQPSSRPPLQLLEAHLSEHVQPSVAPVTQAGWLGGGPVPSPQRHLEKAIATHSSTLAWKILWPEDPGGLQSMGSQRVRHD